MTITPAGYVFFLVLLSSITLAVFVNKRYARDKGKPLGCIGGAYSSLIVVTVTTLFVSSVIMLASQLYSWSFHPKYKATIVDVTSEWVEQDSQDDDGFNRTERIEMHTAILEFYDSEKNLIRINNNIRSGKKPTLGKQLSITYKDGKLTELSIRSVLIYFALAIMMLLLGSISSGILLYALNKNTKPATEFATGLVFYCVVPAGMLALLLGMLYGLWDHYANDGEMPVWAQGVAIFFSIVLIISLTAYLSRILKNLNK